MTTVAPGVVEIERRIEARPEIVFSYFTDPDRYRLWQGVDAELDPRPGGIFRVTVTGRSGQTARGRFVEVEPPRRLVFTWGWEHAEGLPDDPDGVWLGPGASTVEVTFTAEGDATILRLRHSGLPTDASCRFHTFGWEHGLERLVVVAAGGDPGPDEFARW